MKQIIISIYDSAYYWTIATREDGKPTRTIERYYDDEEYNNEGVKEPTMVENMIIKSNFIGCGLDIPSRDDIISQLNQMGYDVIVCDDGDYEEHLSEVNNG